MEKVYTSEQINLTRQLCELLNDIPDKKQEVVNIAMLSYMNGIEFGMLYSKHPMKYTQKIRRKSDEKSNSIRVDSGNIYRGKHDKSGRRVEE